MQFISAIDLHDSIKKGNHFKIIDVREPYEYEACNIGSQHIPMGDIPERVEDLPKDINIVIMCRSGKRAEAVANLLVTDYSLTNVYCLDGGILAWKEHIDNTLDID